MDRQPRRSIAQKSGIFVCAIAVATVGAPIPRLAALGDSATAKVKNRSGADIGHVTFSDSPVGVLLNFDLKGLAPGTHAVHIYETGACEGDFSSAGAIYNPLGGEHGLLNETGPMAGDLPNIHVGPDGIFQGEIISSTLSLHQDGDDGMFDTDGTAIIVRSGIDDHETQPDGGAGERLACGDIKAD